MALARYVITAPLPSRRARPLRWSREKPGTGGAAGFGSTGISAGHGTFPQTFQPGTPIILDSASPLFVYLNGQGALRPYQQGTDDVGHAAGGLGA